MSKEIKRRCFLFNAVGLPAALIGITGTALTATPDTLYDIEIRNFKFTPAFLEVHPGDKIRWTNQDLTPHTATAEDGSWDTGELKKGQSAIVDVTENMSATYICAFHPQMLAKLSVR